MYTINCKGKLLQFTKPLLMGILNATSDSFYKGYLNDGIDQMVLKAKVMLQEGADIIDIGGQSTKPGSTQISENEELSRVIPLIEAVLLNHPQAVISIDTFYSKVATEAVKAGACIVNDVSGGNLDDQMISTVGKLNVPYICMHMQGNPSNMQTNPQYENIMNELLDFFLKKIAICKEAGIQDIIIDPGFGFGKTQEHNYKILKNLSTFKILERPILVGLSRKGMIYKTLEITADEALNGTTVLNTIALMKGASIVRVHDIKAAKETIDLLQKFNQA